ncbi:hypothetical protein VPH35_005121 [Triticum aestivum]
MGMEAGAPDHRSKKRKAPATPATEAPCPEPALPIADGDGGGAGGNRISDLPDAVSLRPRAMEMETAVAAATSEGDASESTADDHLSGLPDGVLGDIVSLLPTREGACTQVLSSRWRHLWRSAPLNLDHRSLCDHPDDLNSDDLDAVMSHILSVHNGPVRRFCAPVYHLHGDRAATVDAWLQSSALDNLQELELCSSNDYRLPPPTLPPPAAAFRFSETLCVAIFRECHIPDSTAQALRFPMLKKLGLKRVNISESSLQAMFDGCPALECLMISCSSGFRCVRINSISLRSIYVKSLARHTTLRFEQLIIKIAPLLMLLQLGSTVDLRISVIFAPKLETLGCLTSYHRSTTLKFDSSAIIQGLRVDSLTKTVRSVKILCVDTHSLSLDSVIDLMRCFPFLERLYIESRGPGIKKLWRRKHRNTINSLDMRLKTIVWRYYSGMKSDVDFATFFLLNAGMLELITLEVDPSDYKVKFFRQQRKKLQLDKKASRGARIHITPGSVHQYVLDYGVHDLDLADPFRWRRPYKFRALS